MLGTAKLHPHDTPTPVLGPGCGKTNTGRLWVCVRGDRLARRALGRAVGRRLSGLKQLAREQPDEEAACWAHACRVFFDIHEARRSLIAAEALQRIGALYARKGKSRGKESKHRAMVRQTCAEPLLDALHAWIKQTLAQVSKKTALGKAIVSDLPCWTAVT